MSTPAVEFEVVIMSPDEKIWEGTATSVSSENSMGKFDVLAQHANFVTMIKNKPISVRRGTEEDKTFTYKNAVLVVSDSKVKIYTDL